jgi:hypothetical protein
LETGATALSLATPQHEPPPKVWLRIEEAVTREANQNRASSRIPFGWLRNGWAAATACLLGWVLYALWVNVAGMNAEPTRVVSVEDSAVEVPPTNLVANATAPEPRGPAVTTNATQSQPKMSLAAMGQISGLRRQVMDLEAQLAQLSQAVTQQQALLSDPDRLKFFHLLPSEFDGITSTNMPPPSPALQRALLLAVARELGWLPATDTESGENLGVDFVDLPLAGTNQTVTTQSANSEPDPEIFSSSPSNAIPGYVLAGMDGNSDVVLALDSTVLPGATTVDLWGQVSQTDDFTSFGTVAVGDNPMVLTVHGVNSFGISEGGIFRYGPVNLNPVHPISTNAP